MSESIAQIMRRFSECETDQLENMIREYEGDEREGVKKLIKRYKNQLSALEREKQRTEKMKEFEHKYADYSYICGIDEVGRGPLAGPVVAGAVILPKDCDILYINDSKQLSEKQREELYDEIMDKAVAIGVGSIPNTRIDEINILQATYEAMRNAINSLSIKPDILLNDAVHIPEVDIKQISIIKGDEKSISIAAASIIAKVTRDRLMIAYDRLFPGYGFASNKGYGSAEHIEALKKLGPTPVHRASFILKFINGESYGKI